MKSRTLYSLLLTTFFVLAAVVMNGCLSGQTDISAEPEVNLTWPAEPLPPRIAWRGTVETGAGGTVQEGIWRRLAGFIFGRREAGIVRPHGVYRDERGQLFLADPGGGALHQVDPQSGRYRTVRGGEAVRLLSPVGVTGDGAGTVYLTDSHQHAVLRYGVEDGTFQRLPQPMRQPTGIAFNHRNGRLYVAETAAHCITVLDTQGRVQRHFGRRGAGEGEFNFPTSVAVDAKGRVLVTDALNGRIQVFTPQGEFLRAFGALGDTVGYFARPKGIALDSEGHIYVVDALLDTVQLFDSEGRLLLHFGTRGRAKGEFWMPSGIFIDSEDRIYVADTYNRRVQIFEYLGDPESPKGRRQEVQAQ